MEVGASLEELVLSLGKVWPRPPAPPLPSLGYTLCQRGDGQDDREFLASLQGMLEAGVPFDSHCIDQTLLQSAFSINQNFKPKLG